MASYTLTLWSCDLMFIASQAIIHPKRYSEKPLNTTHWNSTGPICLEIELALHFIDMLNMFLNFCENPSTIFLVFFKLSTRIQHLASGND